MGPAWNDALRWTPSTDPSAVSHPCNSNLNFLVMSILVRSVSVCKDPWIWIFGENKDRETKDFWQHHVIPHDSVGRSWCGQSPLSLLSFTYIYTIWSVSLTWLIAFNHNQSSNAEAEYDRLRNLARQEHNKRASLSDRVWILTLWKAPGCWYSSFTRRPVKPTNREMEQQLMNYQRRARNMGN